MINRILNYILMFLVFAIMLIYLLLYKYKGIYIPGFRPLLYGLFGLLQAFSPNFKDSKHKKALRLFYLIFSIVFFYFAIYEILFPFKIGY